MVRNSIDLNTVKPKLEEKNKHIKRIGTLGRITYARNPKLFNALALNHPELEFIWIGDGELKHFLTAPNITITGWFTQYASGIEALKQFGIKHDVKVISAHRTPKRLHKFLKEAEKNKMESMCFRRSKRYLY